MKVGLFNFKIVNFLCEGNKEVEEKYLKSIALFNLAQQNFKFEILLNLIELINN